MAEIIYIRERRIKQDLKETETALCEIRSLRAMGVEIPNEVFEELELAIARLESMLVSND